MELRLHGCIEDWSPGQQQAGLEINTSAFLNFVFLLLITQIRLIPFHIKLLLCRQRWDFTGEFCFIFAFTSYFRLN